MPTPHSIVSSCAGKYCFRRRHVRRARTTYRRPNSALQPTWPRSLPRSARKHLQVFCHLEGHAAERPLRWASQLLTSVCRHIFVKRGIPYVAAFVLIAAALYMWPIRPFLHGMRQVRTIADGRTISTLIEQYRERYGAYPAELAAAVPAAAVARGDGWGNRWVYVTDGSSFLLLSFGRDGRPERSDYRLPPPRGTIKFHSTCG